MQHRHPIDPRHFRALFFDFDGTLVDTEPIQLEAFAQTLAQYGAKYVSYSKHLSHYIGRGSRYIFTQEIKRNNLKVDIEKLLSNRNARYIALVKEKGIPVIAGVKSFLENAKSCGMKLAIVSGGHKDNILFVMDHAGLPNIFNAIVSIEDVVVPKPDPEGFLKAIERCQASSQQSVSFEDGLSGIAAAKAANIGLRFAITHSLDLMQVKKVDMEAIPIHDFLSVNIK